MKPWILPFLCAALAIPAAAQDDRTATAVPLADTVAMKPDTLWHGVAFSPLEEFEAPQATAAARARDERASTRSSPSPVASSTSSGRSIERTKDGPALSVQRALDPEGRKHWQGMSKRSVRRSPNSPPGTVPVH